MIVHYFKILAIILLLGFVSCDHKDTLFTELSESQTGVHFNNRIETSDDLNIMKYEYIYNGGGVAIADFNNDGLQDLFFTGNQVANALYLNQGDFKFRDVSEEAELLKQERWNTGVTVADINFDGLIDIYITASGHRNTANRANQLLICQRISAEGIPVYKDMAEEYGLLDNNYSTHAAFFDYDNDLDLDLIVINNHMIEDRQPSKYRQRIDTSVTARTDRLYENKMNETLGHPYFTDVSEQAGILQEGFSLGLNIHDFNQDGWKDIFITNDYLTTDLLYINQQDGTFKNEADLYFKHTSFSAMGNDVVDLDNDGRAEVIAVDMLPDDNYRRKTMLPPNNYTAYINNEKFGYQYQQVRNTLQKNNFNKDIAGIGPVFSEQALISGIAATDWSWAPIVADFDNDGDRDLIVTNGFPQDITDRDFIDYNTQVGAYASDTFLLQNVPSIKIQNVAFENQGNLKFKEVNEKWGIVSPTFSNGGAYGDLDNDGDLDYVVNNINDAASIFENNSLVGNHWLNIELMGTSQNPLAIGSQISIYQDSIVQTVDYTTNHGYLSSMQLLGHFGVGKKTIVDSVLILWPDNQVSVLKDVKVDQTLTVSYADSEKRKSTFHSTSGPYLFSNINSDRNVEFIAPEVDYNDFNIQPMLLHKLSQYGPGIAVGDIDADGLEDFYISGSHFNSGKQFFQNGDGTYRSEELQDFGGKNIPGEELGCLLIDFDNDGYKDLYTALGGYEYDLIDTIYQDRIYLNVNGKLEYDVDALPHMLISSGVVRGGDMDGDGDIDLFVGGRVEPGKYPEKVSSFILRNDSRPGKIVFQNITNDVAPELNQIGMVTDALWSDYNNDNQLDLVIVGEFMPVTVLSNNKGRFKIVNSNLKDKIGWWNSLVAGDFDEDGDMDYIAGNFGDNTSTEITKDHPIRVYFKDFDNNGTKDLLPTCWFEDVNGVKQEFPYFGRLEYEKQMVKIKGKFKRHNEFARATINEILSIDDQKDALVLTANYMKSSYIENKGNGDFIITALSDEVQVSPIYGMLVEDVNADGHLDVIMIGNDFSTEVAIGRMDGHDGLVLSGNGDGTFNVLPAAETGFYVQGDGKSLTQIYNHYSKSFDILATQNKGPLLAYKANSANIETFKWENSETHAVVQLENGRQIKIERGFGSSYLAQLSDYVQLPAGFQNVIIYNVTGESRRL